MSNEFHPFRTADAKMRFLSAYDARAEQWPVASETTLIKTSYGQTFVRISGPVNGPSMVLLHGHSENSLNWLPNIKELSQRHRTYTIDIISDPGRSTYTKILRIADDFSNWLDEVLDGLGLNVGINLVGLSYGGWLAIQYALRFQQKVKKLVLIAPAGISSFPLRFIVFAIFLSLFQFRIKFLFERLTRWMFIDFLKSSENEDEFNDWFDFIYLGMKSHKSQPIVFAKTFTDKELQSLKVPTLFLTGQNEIVYSVEKAINRLQSLTPNVETEVIKNAGHDLPIARPQEVNRAILKFLSDEDNM
ncbi:MAG: alpha/beta hydrolase [Leptolyngbya sp. SIO1D8]|nr:alpha/beta hydrolase [Leptolyngbya sp. SIO1D8]